MFKRVLRKFSETAAKSAPKPSIDELEKRIILASLLHVTKTGTKIVKNSKKWKNGDFREKLIFLVGFTDEALSRACTDLDLSSAANRLVKAGPISIVNHLIDSFEEKFPAEFKRLESTGKTSETSTKE